MLTLPRIAALLLCGQPALGVRNDTHRGRGHSLAGGSDGAWRASGEAGGGQVHDLALAPTRKPTGIQGLITVPKSRGGRLPSHGLTQGVKVYPAKKPVAKLSPLQKLQQPAGTDHEMIYPDWYTPGETEIVLQGREQGEEEKIVLGQGPYDHSCYSAEMWKKAWNPEVAVPEDCKNDGKYGKIILDGAITCDKLVNLCHDTWHDRRTTFKTVGVAAVIWESIVRGLGIQILNDLLNLIFAGIYALPTNEEFESLAGEAVQSKKAKEEAEKAKALQEGTLNHKEALAEHLHDESLAAAAKWTTRVALAASLIAGIATFIIGGHPWFAWQVAMIVLEVGNYLSGAPEVWQIKKQFDESTTFSECLFWACLANPGDDTEKGSHVNTSHRMSHPHLGPGKVFRNKNTGGNPLVDKKFYEKF